MIRCKHVSDALRDHNWKDLPKRKRFWLRLHVRLCGICGRFHRQVMQMQDGVRTLVEHEEDLNPDCCLDAARKAKIRDSVRQAITED